MEVLLDTCGRGIYLLLIYIFLLKAAAECPKPETNGNIVLTNDALLMNDFPEGSEVTLECATGYEIESGSGVINCIDGKWTKPDLTCRKKDCGPPTPKPNMSFNTSQGTLFGALATVICDKGYQLSGLGYKQCFDGGWGGRAKCEIVLCDIPAQVANGRIVWDSKDDPKYGEVIQFVCDEGYTLDGTDSIKCGETGEYDFMPPQCVGVTTERTTTKMVTSPPVTPTPAAGTSSGTTSSETSTAHRDKTITTSSTPAVSPSARGGGDIMTAEDTATSATSVTPTTSSFEDRHKGDVYINMDIGNILAIGFGVFCALVAAVGLFLCRSLKKKGSYDTREDQKPELLPFQRL
ncbi:complement factor H-like isoform X3 [Lates japonicus]|uniref:Complement factor H-like isoform X3 n=1 Tax=Lates japonicus TaxID=270547 RepID=A0AAD3N193_LATJO|nr:complement factor H-like isoform X3 [Lates japonicus]